MENIQEQSASKIRFPQHFLVHHLWNGQNAAYNFSQKMIRSYDYFREIHFIAENFSRTSIFTAIFPEFKRYKTVTTMKY